MPRPKLKIPEGVTVVSSSQIGTAIDCWRKWGFAAILGQRDPSGRGAAFGGVVHERHEDYLEHGTVPKREETWTFRQYLEYEGASSDRKRYEAAHAVLAKTSKAQLDKPMYPGKVALNMMPQGIYPAPGTGEVEKHFILYRDEHIWYQGLMDWHVYDAPSRRLKVIDHKTSSGPRKYGLTDETMPGNKQVVIYARAGLDMYPDAEHIDMYWSYGKSDGVAKHSYVAEAHFDNVGEVHARFENDVHPWAVEIHRLKTMGADPLSLDPNPNSCWLYNQECSHARECNLTSADKIGALMTDGNSLLQGLLAGANAGATPAAAVPPPPAPADVVSPPEAGGPVATAPALPLPVAKPAATPKAPAPLPPQAAAAAAPAPAVPPAPPAVPSAAAAPSPVATTQPVLEIPENFWNAVAQGVVDRIVEALSKGLSK